MPADGLAGLQGAPQAGAVARGGPAAAEGVEAVAVEADGGSAGNPDGLAPSPGQGGLPQAAWCGGTAAGGEQRLLGQTEVIYLQSPDHWYRTRWYRILQYSIETYFYGSSRGLQQGSLLVFGHNSISNPPSVSPAYSQCANHTVSC